MGTFISVLLPINVILFFLELISKKGFYLYYTLLGLTFIFILTEGKYILTWSISFTAASTSGPDPVWEIRHLLPEANLENNTVTNVTVQVGATAFLPCLFRHLADHQVSEQQVCRIITLSLWVFRQIRINWCETEKVDCTCKLISCHSLCTPFPKCWMFPMSSNLTLKVPSAAKYTLPPKVGCFAKRYSCVI